MEMHRLRLPDMVRLPTESKSSTFGLLLGEYATVEIHDVFRALNII